MHPAKHVILALAIMVLALVPLLIYVTQEQGAPRDGYEDLALMCLKEEPLGDGLSPTVRGYSLSEGLRAPGSWAGAVVDVSGKPGLSFTLQVYRIGDTLELLYSGYAEPSGVTVVGWRLPRDGDVRYLLLLAALDGDDVAGVACSIVETPSRAPVVMVYMDKPRYRPGDTAGLIVINEGPRSIEFGRMYTVYRWNGSGWERSPVTPSVWTMELIVLHPGGAHVEEVSLARAEPGVYRIVKTINVEGAGGMQVEAVFRVEP